MRTRTLALPLALTLSILLTSTAFAQVRPPPRLPTVPTNPVAPGMHRYEQPATIVIPAPNTSGASSETMVFNPNGSITIIHQTGSDIFVTTY